jgi:beta-glucosidase
MKNKFLKNSKIALLLAFIYMALGWHKKDENSKPTLDPIIKIDGLTFYDLNKNGKLDPYEDYRLTLDDRIKDLINKMTDDEKTSMLIGIGMPGIDLNATPPAEGNDPGKVPGAAGGTFEIKRLGIPSVIVADGPAGLRIKPTRENDTSTYYATAFPVGTALASTWNEKLINTVGQSIGSEVKEYGVGVLLGPGMNIHRNPLCGRNFEYYSEDPLVSGKIAAAMVNGIQSNGVGTSIKHFAANNQERNRMNINAHISERALREIYLRGFEIAVKESQPWTIMSSYNLINGTYTSERKDLLTTILRDEWGYKGLVMTDWFGGYDSFSAPFSKNTVSNVTAQLTAGNDLLMPGLLSQKLSIIEQLKSGKLTKETIDKNLYKILPLVFKSPAMNQYKYSNKPNLKNNAQIARDAATEGIILLRNDKNTLPFLSKKAPLAVFGVTSYDFISGGTGSGDVNEAYTISLIEGLTNAGYAIDKELESLYVPFTQSQKEKEMKRREKEGGLLATPQRPNELELNDEIVENKANSSEIALITIGRNAGEAADRNIVNDFNLAPDEVKLINSVSQKFHAKGKKVVVILNIGGVIETASWKDKVDAILLPWQSGQEGGNSVVDVFSGKVNPSGKLTMTFPTNYEDTPSAKNWIGTPPENPTSVTYEEGIYVGYRYFNSFNIKPSYEFGYGLSYTTFDYSTLILSSTLFKDKITATITIKNTGKMAGKEVVELYLSAPSQKSDKPVAELKAFGKTNLLQPNESQTISFKLNPKDLASFVSDKKAWIAEAGAYKVSVGPSSLNIKKTVQFDVEKESIIEKTNAAFPPDLFFSDLKH